MQKDYCKTESSQLLLKGIDVFFEETEVEKSQVKTLSDMQDIFDCVAYQLVQKKVYRRFLAYNPNFVKYPEGVRQTHIEAFLKVLLDNGLGCGCFKY